MKSKICGISDTKTLEFLTNHSNPPDFIGFIINYPKSSRFVEFNKLQNLLNIDKKNSLYVAVLVNPDQNILEKIKNLPFDYYQIYDCEPNQMKIIKEKYKKKVIAAFTIESFEDVEEHLLFKNITDIYLFDSKVYEKSLSFNHSLIKNIKLNKEVMLAGNIQFNDELESYREIADIIDISGGLETSGLKDITKIDIFLKKIKEINNDT